MLSYYVMVATTLECPRYCMCPGFGYRKFLPVSIECLHARATLLFCFSEFPDDFGIKPDGETRRLLEYTVCVVERRLELLASGGVLG